MANEYRFFLNGVECDEPNGWDATQMSLRRSDEFSGLEFSFSDTMSFVGNGLSIVKAAYEADGIDAAVSISITDCGTLIYTGVINFAVYSETDACPDDCAETVTVGVMQSGLTQKFRNRMDTPINLSDSVGVDGQALTPLSYFDLPLHSKELIFESDYKINEALAEQELFQNILPLFFVVPPMQAQVREVDESFEPIEYQLAPDFSNSGSVALFYSGFEYPAGITIRTLHVTGRFRFDLYSFSEIIGLGSGDEFNEGYMSLRLAIRRATEEVEISNTVLVAPTFFNTSFESRPFVDFSFDVNVDFPPDTNLFIYLVWEPRPADIDIVIGDTYERYTFITRFDLALSFLHFTENSVYPASTTKAILVHEAFQRICESITGQTGIFKSDFFGGTTSLPDAYASDGCERYLALTNGLNIRKLLNKDGSLFPITSSFKALFDGLNAIFSLGMRMELEEGVERIRVEPKRYFYNTDVSITMRNVSEIKRSVSLNDIYNEAEFGYQKWETEFKNGIDEFNSKRNYLLPVIQAKRKLSQMSSLVTAGYVIELTRRQQYKEDASKDTSYDNENFLIACVKSGGFIQPQKTENFTSIENVISPETAYNLRLSPARMLLNWYPVLAASMVKKTDPVIKFLSGTGNYKLSDTRTDACRESADELSESQDIALEDVAPRLRAPYVEPENYLFEYPISFSTFLSLRAKAIFAIQFGCKTLVKGYLKEVVYRPNGDGGIATFTVIKAYDGD